MFSFGIEHEVAFLNDRGEFADFSRTRFAELDRIVEQLPVYPEDYAQLRLGDAGIKEKRWYIEGFERFSQEGKVIDCIPKGIEIRTTIHPSIEGAIAELAKSFAQLATLSRQAGFTPVLISFNPHYTAYEPQPPLNGYERERRQASPEKQTADLPMLTYGPDLNFSIADCTPERAIDIGEKLTFYSPYIIPFSFSSPFSGGERWPGLSARTHARTGPRPAAMVFLETVTKQEQSSPSLVKIARIPAEVGRIEFKAFDSCDDFQLYGSLLALLKGIARDRNLPGRARTPDRALHQLSAREGFDSETIRNGCAEVLAAAEVALADDPDLPWLSPLRASLAAQKTPAHRLIEAYEQFGIIEQALKHTYPTSRQFGGQPPSQRDSSSIP